MLADIQASTIHEHLAKLRRDGLSIQTSNFYLQALKQFFNWMMKDQRIGENPIQHLQGGNVKLDRRHDRRNFTSEEFQLLLNATRQAPERSGLSGEDRAMLYLTAIGTGLRASELASLSISSFNLTSIPPTVIVEAGYSKRKRRDTLPLHPELVKALAPWLQGRTRLLWPGKWASQKRAGKILAKDIEAARSAWLASLPEAERSQADVSDFLKPEDSQGRFLDFHSLRHSFITNVVQGGASAKEAMQLARHSTVTLTLDRYSHVGLEVTAKALNKIQLLPTSEPGDEARRVPKRVPLFEETCSDLRKTDEQESPGISIGVMPGQESQLLENQGFDEVLAEVRKPDERKGRDSNPGLGQAQLRFSRPVH
jgi:site-specific recombinase XerD